MSIAKNDIITVIDPHFMSGHSKWSQIKRQKGAVDREKGAVFTKLGQAITLAVRLGNGISDPQTNIRLRLAIEKAREENMPNDNIAKAIHRAVADSSGRAAVEEHIYEGFGPGNIPLLVQCVTNNKQRTYNSLRNIFHQLGGVIADPGSVAYQFSYCGVIEAEKSKENYDWYLEMAIKAGCSDIEINNSKVYFFTAHENLHLVKDNLVKEGIVVKSCQLTYLPKNKVKIDNPKLKGKFDELLKYLQENEDVLNIYAAIS